MVEELKTLKGLIEEVDCNDDHPPIRIIWPGIIRAEAIKWVKEIQEGFTFDEIDNCKSRKGLKLVYSNSGEFIGFDAEEFIKHFFNISEEDLK